MMKIEWYFHVKPVTVGAEMFGNIILPATELNATVKTTDPDYCL